MNDLEASDIISEVFFSMVSGSNLYIYLSDLTLPNLTKPNPTTSNLTQPHLT